MLGKFKNSFCSWVGGREGRDSGKWPFGGKPWAGSLAWKDLRGRQLAFPGLLAVVNDSLFMLGQQWTLPGNGPASSEKSLSLKDQEARKMGWVYIERYSSVHRELSMSVQMAGSIAGLVSRAVATADMSKRNATGFCWTGACDTIFSFIRKPSWIPVRG